MCLKVTIKVLKVNLHTPSMCVFIKFQQGYPFPGSDALLELRMHKHYLCDQN